MKVLARSFVLVIAVFPSAPVMGQWSTATLSALRDDLAATSVGGKAIFAGGQTLSGCPPFGPCLVPSAAVDIYDDATGTWSRALLSGGRYDLAATTVGTKAIFGGGATTGESDVVDIYDDSLGLPPSNPAAWSTATLSQARTDLAATTVGTKAMFGGGETSTGSSAVVDIYDDATGTWSTATLSQPRGLLAATTVGSKAMFAGGQNSSGLSDVVDIYDDATGTWSTATLSQARAFLAATTVGTKGMFGGGWATTGESDVVDIYDDSLGLPPSNPAAWSTVRLSQARADLAETTVGTKAMFGAGWAVTGLVDIYDDATGQWTTAGMTPGGRHAAATTVGTRAMLSGGGAIGHWGAVAIYDDAIGGIYCSPAAANSTGIPATVTAQGFPGSVVQGYALLTANQLPPNQFGYFLNSMTQGLTTNPGGSQGNLCLAGSIGRYANNVFDSGSLGRATLQLELTNTPTPTGFTSITAGQTWNFQAWYRDLNPGPTSNFTDAVSVAFL